MTRSFKLGNVSGSPSREGKATWTHEDRDFVWLTRARRFLPALLMALPAITGAWCVLHGTRIDGSIGAPYKIATAIVIFGGATIGTAALWRFDRWMGTRFPYRRERELYAGRAWPPCIGEEITALEPVDLPRSKLLADRAAILKPLRRRVIWFKKLMQRTAIAQWTIAALSLAYATSAQAQHAHHVGAALVIALALIASGMTWPVIWHVLIYDVPARYNPMYVPVQLSQPMAGVLQDACEDDGHIWLVDHKVVPRALFKTPFGPLLLGEPWTTAYLPFGLWVRAAHIRKEMSGEIRGYSLTH